MKKLLLYIILLSYAVVMLKPVLPYINDVISHTFFYAHHMATVHYENGKYHVHYEIARDIKDQKSDKSTSSNLKKDNLTNEHLVTSCLKNNFIVADLATNYLLRPSPDLLNGNVKNNYPPPRV
ncbi:hypothetical protein [Ferruginibacter sp.]|uniref:hypothetical protein n=1 Tax=Ferruginibacter sp. TaxID=1940288 RepID=UPI0019847A7C|nr:hypothetical protein [Ferruginibacter sp.]MBC7627141.1 hypothetical protein [Ferruginibacter sp.]